MPLDHIRWYYVERYCFAFLGPDGQRERDLCLARIEEYGRLIGDIG